MRSLFLWIHSIEIKLNWIQLDVGSSTHCSSNTHSKVSVGGVSQTMLGVNFSCISTDWRVNAMLSATTKKTHSGHQTLIQQTAQKCSHTVSLFSIYTNLYLSHLSMVPQRFCWYQHISHLLQGYGRSMWHANTTHSCIFPQEGINSCYDKFEICFTVFSILDLFGFALLFSTPIIYLRVCIFLSFLNLLQKKTYFPSCHMKL